MEFEWDAAGSNKKELILLFRRHIMDEFLKKRKVKVDVVVLMAGEGKRMRPFTSDRPKALILCEDGLSLLHHTINSFSLPELEPTFMPVIGHGAKKVHEEIEKLSQTTSFNCIYNPFYDTSGPIISLLFGLLQTQSENVVVVNGDTLFRPTLTEKLASWLLEQSEVRNHAGLCVSLPKVFTDDDMKVSISEEFIFEEVGKKVIPTKSTLKSAGVLCIKGENSKRAFMNKLQSILMDSNSLKTSYHWHNILNEVKEIFQIDLINVETESWYEIDTPEELDILNAL